MLCGATRSPRLAFQQVPSLPEPTWPEGPRPQMLHLDTTSRPSASCIFSMSVRLLSGRAYFSTGLTMRRSHSLSPTLQGTLASSSAADPFWSCSRIAWNPSPLAEERTPPLAPWHCSLRSLKLAPVSPAWLRAAARDSRRPLLRGRARLSRGVLASLDRSA